MKILNITQNEAIFCELAINIDRAVSRIDICTYVFEGRGWMSRMLIQRLCSALQRGVHIRLLSSQNTTVLKKSQHRRLSEFICLFADEIKHHKLEIRVFKHALLNNFHLKLAMFDDKHCMIFSNNIQPNSYYSQISEIAISMEGVHITKRFTNIFNSFWTRSSLPCFKLANKLVKTGFENDDLPEQCSALSSRLITVVSEDVPRWSVVAQNECSMCLRNTRMTDVTKSFINLIQNAKYTIDILGANMSDTRILNLLKKKVVDDGVRVRIHTTLGFNKSGYKKLYIRTNLEAFHAYKNFFNFRWSNLHNCDQKGENCKTVPNDDIVMQISDSTIHGQHCKLAIFDNKHVQVGSSNNVDTLSMTHSAEADLVMTDMPPKTKAAFIGIFLEFWNSGAELII